MQRPTCNGLRVRSPADAQVIFHAVSLNILPMVSRRLDTEERRAISSGCVFVWEERGPNSEATGLGIERWTDGIRWGPSRVRDEFLFYHEKDPEPMDIEMGSDSDSPFSRTRSGPSDAFLRENLIKQTYSVFVETPRGRRKWHLIAYFTQESLDYLRSIDDITELASLPVPPGKYKSARSAKGRPRDHQQTLGRVSPMGVYAAHPQPQYAPYTPGGPADIASHRSANNSSPWIDEAGRRTPSQLASRSRQRLMQQQSVSGVLAPLSYLQNIPPLRRHPLDEKALMSFAPTLA
jgi:hypothetical protein